MLTRAEAGQGGLERAQPTTGEADPGARSAGDPGRPGIGGMGPAGLGEGTR
jgi:hypothetical protein